MFSDILRKTVKENSFVGKNSSDGQLDSYSCHFRTHDKTLQFDVLISNIIVASTKQTLWQMKWNVRGFRAEGRPPQRKTIEDKTKTAGIEE